jgi:hypothetical protein
MIGIVVFRGARPAPRNDLGPRRLRAPDGGYGIVSGIILYVWVAVVSGLLTMRSPSMARAPQRAAVPTA